MRPHSVVSHPADPDVLYVTSEEHGHVVQVNATSGETLTVIASKAHHVSGFGIDGRRHNYGHCRDNNPKDLYKHCTGAGAEEEESNMPPHMRSMPCQVEAHCHPELINSTYLSVESASSCDFQAILRHVNETDRRREEEAVDGGVFPILKADIPGRFKYKFDGWLRDRALKSPYAVQFHKDLGLLVSTGSTILRYDAVTGEMIQTLVDIGAVGEESQKGEVTCFHVE